MSWREASHRCHSYGGYLPQWKTAQHMLSHNDEVIIYAYSMHFEYAEVTFIGLVSKVSVHIFIYSFILLCSAFTFCSALVCFISLCKCSMITHSCPAFVIEVGHISPGLARCCYGSLRKSQENSEMAIQWNFHLLYFTHIFINTCM